MQAVRLAFRVSSATDAKTSAAGPNARAAGLERGVSHVPTVLRTAAAGRARAAQAAQACSRSTAAAAPLRGANTPVSPAAATRRPISATSVMHVPRAFMRSKYTEPENVNFFASPSTVAVCFLVVVVENQFCSGSRPAALSQE